MLPEFSLLDVRKAEFPVLFRLIDAVQEALSLFFLRKMQEELDDPGAVAMQMLSKFDDRPIPPLPDSLVIDRLVREPFVA